MATSNCNTKRRSFSHLTPYQRGQIQLLREQGKSMQCIADTIGCHKSTISRELKRGTVIQRRSDLTEYEAYFPDAGQAVYEKNKARCGAKYKMFYASDFIQYAVKMIQKEEWSPDSICGRAKKDNLFDGKFVSTKTLYAYIDHGLLPIKNIDLPLKVVRSTKKKRVRKNKKVLGKSIEERPKHVEERSEFGHWEIDTVLGKRKSVEPVLLTLTERKTRMEHIIKIQSKTAEEVEKGMAELKAFYGVSFTDIFKTITSDNGSEFSALKEAVDTNTEVYYTHPYTSCERGTNERHNGLIRRFIPKGKSIKDIDPTLVSYVENWMNTLPRKILNYRTPMEAFEHELARIIPTIISA